MLPPLLSAAHRQPTPYTPIWLMRQAGRSLPAYLELRSRYSFKELTSDPELIARVTMMPFDVADLDAAILFADMMSPVPSLGLDYEIAEGVGPVVDEPVRSLADVERLVEIPVEETCGAIFEAITGLAGSMPRDVALIGFAGAPFTLASYLIEGRPDRALPETRRLMQDDGAWATLMDKVCDLLISYLQAQVASGVQIVQLFDSWAGSLETTLYTGKVLPYTQRVCQALGAAGVPRIHFGTDTRHLLQSIATLDVEVISVYNDIHLDEAWWIIGDKAIQGNLDPAVLAGPHEDLVEAAQQVLRRAGGRRGHIFNLGHGVLPTTPTDNIKLLVDLVHQETKT